MNQPADWIAPPPEVKLLPGDIHLWRVQLTITPEQFQRFWSILTPDEQARAERFHFDRDRARYVAARGVLRVVISRYLDTPPDQIRFRYSEHGKPALDTEAIQFNVSHSGDVALLAFCRDCAVGVDVERVRPLPNATKIAARFFSDDENATFQALPASQQDEAFFTCWTRKEAFIKAVGEGLSYPLNQFDVTLMPGKPARFLRIRGSAAEAARWSLRSLIPKPDYVGAIAVTGSDWRTSFWRWTEI